MAKARDEFAGQPSQRQLRVGELVRKELSDILTRGRVSDPDLDGVIITVPEVRMSPDLRWADVLVMPMGGRDVEVVLEALKRNAKYLRGQVARRVTMKYTCDLRFVADTRFDDDDLITRLLHEPSIRKDFADGGIDDEDDQGEDDRD
ncbi:30S ribosome-binding factor RbfA [Pseudovibrio brasiliensis]|uniref:Ribosome-binding factor A n=1 Tax=Pseudovibrio brasiliensis TaxID=1898042 RepID=A0ABX8AQS1_9HYPH|nr:30S ribosome-binding factor RbfA [Pseudovibrio brasiliensis]QUS56001.1 30S ribosome-binding factor RbfA [Pseudovibrio brasiliensis]